jgi:hypothetical protein
VRQSSGAFGADGINAKAQRNLSDSQTDAWRPRALALNFYAAALAKNKLVAAAGGVTVPAAMKTLSARAAWHFQIAFHHPIL